MPRARTASDPVVTKFVECGRDTHGKILAQTLREVALSKRPLLLTTGVRFEQQASAKFDLSYVRDE